MKDLTEALEQIKKLKCCGNCKDIRYYHKGLTCKDQDKEVHPHDLCKEWKQF
jgi:hypothetical protein